MSYGFLHCERRSVDGRSGATNDAPRHAHPRTPLGLCRNLRLLTLEKRRRVSKIAKVFFAWIDAFVISGCHMLETMTTTPPVTNDLIDLFTTNLFVIRSSPSALPSTLTQQLPAHNFSGISILHLDCDYLGPAVSPDLKHATITTSLNSAPTGGLLLVGSGGDAMDPKSPPSHNLAPSDTLTTAIPLHLRDASEYPPIQKEVQRMGAVVKVRISAPEEAKEERKEARSLISGPIISTRIASRVEAGTAAWNRWVEEDAKEDSVISLTSNSPRQNPRSEKLRGGILTLLQRGRGCSMQRAPKG
ncbi:hypothetical protein L873DRAFT_1787415 [Choiromyces venosus 120613-1]|uniref:Uncharacterized protein n=1 Tax=Choiromyces venosus 120613-1 TaxID=1336337 RepID=A0A3N4K1A4_9PEZI|nr:hypothetical protein L873DRAFT_1787415 [Choiromyces venosus 120613-1]